MSGTQPQPPLSHFDLTVPVYRRNLGNLREMLRIAEDHCAVHGRNEAELLALQVASDMFPFVRQVQMTTGMATYVVASLSDRSLLTLPDVETSLGELQLRIDRVDGWLAQVAPVEYRDLASRRCSLPPLGGKTVSLPVERFVTEFALPNFFFHLTVSYTLMRSFGIPLGKSDFIGDLTGA